VGIKAAVANRRERPGVKSALRYTAARLQAGWLAGDGRVDNRLESYAVRQERDARREGQRKSFQRNQAIGLLVAAAAVLVYRLLHTPSGWLFPPGWWRLW
jgi:hypothetical protein